MKTYATILALVLSCFGPLTALAAEHMVAQLSVPSDPYDAQTGKVVLTLRNDGDTNVLILKVKTPSWDTGELGGDVFTVTTTSSSVPYTGFLENPGPPSAANYFTMTPGEVRTVLVDLRKGYHLYGGSYQVTYTLNLGPLPEPPPPEGEPLPPQEDTIEPHDVVSNTVTITVNPSLASG